MPLTSATFPEPSYPRGAHVTGSSPDDCRDGHADIATVNGFPGIADVHQRNAASTDAVPSERLRGYHVMSGNPNQAPAAGHAPSNVEQMSGVPVDPRIGGADRHVAPRSSSGTVALEEVRHCRSFLEVEALKMRHVIAEQVNPRRLMVEVVPESGAPRGEQGGGTTSLCSMDLEGRRGYRRCFAIQGFAIQGFAIEGFVYMSRQRDLVRLHKRVLIISLKFS